VTLEASRQRKASAADADATPPASVPSPIKAAVPAKAPASQSDLSPGAPVPVPSPTKLARSAEAPASQVDLSPGPVDVRDEAKAPAQPAELGVKEEKGGEEKRDEDKPITAMALWDRVRGGLRASAKAPEAPEPVPVSRVDAYSNVERGVDYSS
jgi:hypothetical protein